MLNVNLKKVVLVLVVTRSWLDWLVQTIVKSKNTGLFDTFVLHFELKLTLLDE